MTARSASHAVSADRARDRQFCETEYAALIGYCFRLTGDGELTRVVQEAFVRVLARATWPANPHGYLYATATTWCAGTGGGSGASARSGICWSRASAVLPLPTRSTYAGPLPTCRRAWHR
ncbi:MAG: RNA polymerase sigma factor [Mycobacteriales bacterium]